MFKLHGFAISNYYNMVKFALLKKGLPFEEVAVYPSNDAAFLSISPRGKIPVLQCAEGYISETSAILEYLEQQTSSVSLLPQEPYQQARVRSLVRHIELYIELPARACYPQVFFGQQVDRAIIDKSREELLGGIESLKRQGLFTPYLAGDSLSLADVYFLYSVDLAAAVASKLFEIDLLADFAGARQLFALFAEDPVVQRIVRDKNASQKAFAAYMQARMGR